MYIETFEDKLNNLINWINVNKKKPSRGSKN